MKPTYEELEIQVQELQAHVERLRGYINTIEEAVDNTHYGWDGDCGVIRKVGNIVDAAFLETPAQSLAALKAQWQAEAVESVCELNYGYMQFEEGSFAFTEDAILGYAESIRKRAQEAE